MRSEATLHHLGCLMCLYTLLSDVGAGTERRGVGYGLTLEELKETM